MPNALKKTVSDLFLNAGIAIDGSNPWDITVHNDDFYGRVLAQGSLGLGESYMDGWWDCRSVDQFIARILSAELHKQIKPSPSQMWNILRARITNLQSPRRAYMIGEKHYDIGNDLFQKMLDKRMTYSCAYWKGAKDLDSAQEAKLDLICRKLYLKPGMKILDIGVGWGSFAKYAAEKYGAKVLGITVSRKQLELAKEMCKHLPITLQYEDYRDVTGSFDRIVSVGQMEHVGYKNYRTCMQVCRKNLKDDGLFLLHTIGCHESTTHTDPWISKYIFPNSMIPSSEQLAAAADGLFIIEDLQNFGVDYDPTLMAWYHNFNSHWDSLQAHYSQQFYRMWSYFLLSSAGAFRSRSLQLYQFVFSKYGVPGGYISPR